MTKGSTQQKPSGQIGLKLRRSELERLDRLVKAAQNRLRVGSYTPRVTRHGLAKEAFRKGLGLLEVEMAS